MNLLSYSGLWIGLFVLVLVSGFFSGSETAMMSINRYRLRHLARNGQRSAKRVLKLRDRPDRLLGVILTGNTFANVFASAVATTIATQYYGELGVFLSTILLTIVILIFAETAPKTLAALHPERIAFPASLPLKWLLILLYPIIWLINNIANALLYLLGVKVNRHSTEALSAEELRTVVEEATGKISSSYQKMLVRILDLEQVTVADVMIPRNDIVGVDLNGAIEEVRKGLLQAEHSYLPVYRGDINRVEGLLNVRKALSRLKGEHWSAKELSALCEKAYFLPEAALLNRQLSSFQKQRRTIGLVVDEYGDVQGLITLRDILEEIVGEFSSGVLASEYYIQKQSDGSVLVEASINVRDLNRLLELTLPTEGPNTLSGLIVEYLEMIPQTHVCCEISGCRIEIVEIADNTIGLARLFPTSARSMEK